MLRGTRALAAATGLAVVAGVLITRWTHLEPDPGHTVGWAGQLLSALTYGFVGAALGERVASPSARIAVLLQLTGLTQAIGLTTGSWSRNPGLPLHDAATWLDGWVWTLGVIPLLTVLPLIFPTGTALSRRWRPVTVAAVALCAVFTTQQAVDAWPGAGTGPLLGVLTGMVAVTALAAVASLVLRYRRQDSEGRAQIRWLAWAVVVVLVLEAVQPALPRPLATTALVALPLLLPVAVGLAVSRYRLYDVDLVLSRTATYAVLTALLTAAYLGATLALGLRADDGRAGGTVVVLLAVTLVATPLRALLQRTLDRWLLGDRSPHAAVGRLARRLHDTLAPDSVPAAVVRTVRESLRVPYARLVVAGEGDVPLLAVESGRPGPAAEVPLRYAGRDVGVLTVGQRTPREPLDEADLRMLRTVAEAAAPALDGLLLAAELRRSRQRAATVREEERDRLHRDLHDGLGPTLAGIALGLDAVRNHVDEGDSARAAQAVDRLRELASGATDDIRSLVRGLRPVSLENVGLVETIQRHARLAAAGVQVEVEVVGDLTDLPEAVEVAALHIALEALTNVRRHSGARTCWVRLARSTERLEVHVDDDGQGPGGEASGGIGRASMRERAAELGGASSWGVSPRGGVAVRASLPLATVGA